MLRAPNLEKYRQGDFIQYMNNVLDIVTAARAATLNITPQRAALESEMQTLNAAWQPALGSELTPQLAALDKERDRVFSGFKMMVDNWATNHFDEAKQNAAYIISDMIAGHGNRITLMRYQQQTATLNAIINDLQNQLAAQVTLLNIGDWEGVIEDLNTKFDDLYVQRAQAISGNDPSVIAPMIEDITQLFRNMKNLFDARFAVATADGAATVADFTTIEQEWNTITQQYNDAVNRFSGGEEEDPTPEPPASDPTPTE